jgi:hypothetical protein
VEEASTGYQKYCSIPSKGEPLTRKKRGHVVVEEKVMGGNEKVGKKRNKIWEHDLKRRLSY